MTPKICTLLFLLREDQILLAMKKRGFGKGLWNGVGGKIEQGESVEQALVRECQEEIGVTPTAYDKIAEIHFSFPDDTPDIHAHVYFSKEWQGTPVETDEMAPQWFSVHDIPYDNMWQDDIVWLPQVLQGKKLTCNFAFDAADNMQAAEFKIVSSLD